MKRLNILKMLFGFIWKIKPSIFLYLFISTIFSTLYTIIVIYIPKILLKFLSSNLSIKEIAVNVLILSIFIYLITIVKEYINKKLILKQEIFKEEILLGFAEKSYTIDYANLEDPKILDLKEAAIYGINAMDVLNIFFSGLNGFFINLFTLLTVSVIILQYSRLYFLFLSIASVISLLLSRKSFQEGQKTVQELIPINRRQNYFDGLAMEPKLQKDIRVYNSSHMIISKIREYALATSDWLHRLYSKQSNIKSLRIVIAYIIKLVAYSYGVLRVLSKDMTKNISIGDFTVYIGTTETFSTSFLQAVNEILKINQNIYHLKPFAEFMAIPDTSLKSGDIIASSFETLEFKDVVFKYPKSDKIILDHVSFTINKGDKVSVVGLNSAGKSTIVKLICRFFEADSGEILLNHIPIERYNYDSYNNLISVVFQDFRIFPFTIKDNIALSDTEVDDKKIWEIIHQVELNHAVEKLPNGIHTFLDKSLSENSTDLSGGEKQKIAIARSILKNTDFVILDEPTAALDPLAESEIFEEFHELTKDKTAMFISHRMSASVFCDKVIVLENGKISGYDTHDNLMRCHSFYRKLFEAQSQYYITNEQESR